MAEEAAARGDDLPRFELRHRMALALEWGKVSIAAMAEELELSRYTISNYLHGRTRPSRAVLRVWAMRCGVPFDWLLTGVDPPDSTGYATVLRLPRAA